MEMVIKETMSRHGIIAYIYLSLCTGKNIIQ